MLSGRTKTEGSQNPRSVNVEFIQRRLLDFNEKLEEIIVENKRMEDSKIEFGGLKMNQDLLFSFERERKAIIRKHRGEIAALQLRMLDLQRYCS
jgi:hypothetical protein